MIIATFKLLQLGSCEEYAYTKLLRIFSCSWRVLLLLKTKTTNTRNTSCVLPLLSLFNQRWVCIITLNSALLTSKDFSSFLTALKCYWAELPRFTEVIRSLWREFLINTVNIVKTKLIVAVNNTVLVHPCGGNNLVKTNSA